MPKKTARDYSLAYTVSGVFVLLLAGFAYAWFYQKNAAQTALQTAYSPPAPVITQTGAFSVSARFVVRTSNVDADWAQANHAALEQVVKSVLTATDMRTAMAPGGLRALQASLREACNAALRTTKIQEVLITDFLVGDSSD